MFYGKLADTSPDGPELKRYPETVRRGLAWLKQADLEALPLGKTVIDGDLLYASNAEYLTKAPEQVILEAHRKYVDIQLVIHGREWMGWWTYSEELPVKEAYNAEKDVMFFPVDVMPFWRSGAPSPKKFVVHAGEFAIFAPEDIHASQIFIDKPEMTRKVVVKCRV